MGISVGYPVPGGLSDLAASIANRSKLEQFEGTAMRERFVQRLAKPIGESQGIPSGAVRQAVRGGVRAENS